MGNLSILNQPEFGRCPRCKRLIDVSARECPHCNSFLTASELQAAARLEKDTNLRKSRINNRNAVLYGLLSILAAIVFATLNLGVHLKLWNSNERENVADIAAHLWTFIQSNLLPVVATFVVLPIVVVVMMRWQRRSDDQ
jgi:hypothetical protein